MFGMGIWELLVIFLIVLLFFGAKRLPEIGGSLGKGIREFKDSLGGVEEEVRGELDGSPSTGAPEERPGDGARGGESG